MEVFPVLVYNVVEDLSKYVSVTCSGLHCVEDLGKYGSVTCSGIPCVEDLSKYGSVTFLIYPV